MQSGGLGIYLYALTQELANAGHEVDLFVGPPYPDPMPWARVIPISNERYWDRKFTKGWAAPVGKRHPLDVFDPLNFWEFFVTRFGFFPEPFAFSVRAARAVLGEIRAGRRYDLVHDVQTLGYGLLLLQAIGLPAVATIHHPLTIDRRSSLQRDPSFMHRVGSLTFHPVRTQARVARKLDAMITSSDASIGEIESGFGVERSRIHNVGNGVVLPPPGRVRPRRDPPELVFIGRGTDPNKGLEHLIGALAELPSEITLRVFDQVPLGTPLPDQIKQLGLSERITFQGKVPRPDLEAAIRDAAIVVLPSLFEGFGLPAVEALASGTPIVASAAGALPEVVERAGAGRLVPPGNPSALAKGIAEVLGDWEREQRSAVGARARIEARFGWWNVAERTAGVYTEVVRPARRT